MLSQHKQGTLGGWQLGTSSANDSAWSQEAVCPAPSVGTVCMFSPTDLFLGEHMTHWPGDAAAPGLIQAITRGSWRQ